MAPWVFRSARNAATDAQRRERPTVPGEHVPDAQHPVSVGSLEEEAMLREDLLRLKHLIAGLDPAKHEMLALRFAGKLRIHEIAVVTNKSEDAVQKQLSRIIRSLKEHFDDDQV